MNKKLTIGVTSIVLAGTLGFGAIASAAGNGDGTGRQRPQLTTEQKCDKSDEIIARATTAQTKLAGRVTALQAKRAEAEAAGNTQLVEKIDRRLARVEKVNTRLTTRLAKFQTWVDTNCATTPA